MHCNDGLLKSRTGLTRCKDGLLCDRTGLTRCKDGLLCDRTGLMSGIAVFLIPMFLIFSMLIVFGQPAAASTTSASTTSASTATASTAAASTAAVSTDAVSTTMSALTAPVSESAIQIMAKPELLPLFGFTVCIDPGHQAKAISAKEPASPGSKILKAKDSGGTRGISTKTPESELVLAIGLLLRDELEMRGATVVMTRQDQKSRIGNIDRARIANEAKADLCIRIHADGSVNTKVKGMSVLIPGKKSTSWKAIGLLSEKLGKTLLATVSEKMKPSRALLSMRDDLTGFNWSKVPVVLIEIGFMTNVQEDKLMSGKTWRAKMAGALADGIEAGLLDNPEPNVE